MNSKLHVYKVSRGGDYFLARSMREARKTAVEHFGTKELMLPLKQSTELTADCLRSMELQFPDGEPAGNGLDFLDHFRSRDDVIKPQLFTSEAN